MTKTFQIDFDTKDQPGRIKAVQVTLEEISIKDPETVFNIALSAHPLYSKLERYVLANPSERRK